eukprot:1779136-Prymnesium_polylepis.2
MALASTVGSPYLRESEVTAVPSIFGTVIILGYSAGWSSLNWAKSFAPRNFIATRAGCTLTM